MIRQTVMVFILIQMELNMKVIGKTIHRMEEEEKPG